MNYMMLFAVNLIVITVVGLSVQSCNGQCMYIVSYRATVLDTMSVTLFFVLYSTILFNNYESEVVQRLWQHCYSRGYVADLHIKPVEGNV